MNYKTDQNRDTDTDIIAGVLVFLSDVNFVIAPHYTSSLIGFI